MRLHHLPKVEALPERFLREGWRLFGEGFGRLAKDCARRFVPALTFHSAFFPVAVILDVIDPAVQRFFHRRIEFQALIKIGLRFGAFPLRQLHDSATSVSLGGLLTLFIPTIYSFTRTLGHQCLNYPLRLVVSKYLPQRLDKLFLSVNFNLTYRTIFYL